MIPGTDQACADLAGRYETTASMLAAKMRPALVMQQALKTSVQGAAEMPQQDLDAMLSSVNAVSTAADTSLSADLKQTLQNDCFSGGAPAPVQKIIAAAGSILDLPAALRRQLAAAARAAIDAALSAAAAAPLGQIAMALASYEDWIKTSLGPLFDALEKAFNCLSIVCGQAPVDYAAQYRQSLLIDDSSNFLTATIDDWNASTTVQQQLSGTWAAVKAKADQVREITF